MQAPRQDLQRTKVSPLSSPEAHSTRAICPVHGNSKCQDSSPNGIVKEEVHFAHHNAVLLRHS